MISSYLLNKMNKINQIQQMISQWDLTDRVSWDEYFMGMALWASSRSPCSRLHVGCVLVKDKRVVSMGYNGFLPEEGHNSCIRHDDNGKPHELATVHAEQNAICYGANAGVALNGAIAYITHYPCLNCAKLLFCCGIRKIYYHNDYNNDELVPLICTKLEITRF